MPLTITTPKGFRVRLDFAEKDFIDSNQWPPRCSSIRTDPSYKKCPPNTIFTPFPNQIETQFSTTNQEQTIIANQLEIRLISLTVIVFVKR